ncbi:glutathione S-transferase family protein [Actibacterium sp. 188UL27-1]|uniref:glutathione S-transferase family protein n=1 Tax=Actibacterium sp. 188UL27-1 TaxID=2786961 RepID=UPI00195AE79A|nr:glutathione S-transferase N-terminal domain-containing protein [Actibacterium sp. 188UL27-1]MBM7067920.1 glutathione S-transferase N-terminal domain-containing protein [Actibacterium sp. 188UL27-1]
MTALSSFPITQRWPAIDPTVIQLYSYPTPNGVKVSIALEEMGLDYEAHKVTLSDADVKSDAFLSLNPNNKIPAIIDPNGPDGQPVGMFESGAILLYLAEKTGKLIGRSAIDKAHVTQWLMFQMGSLGPMLGQLGFFTKFAGGAWEDKRPQQRYIAEAKRLLAVLDKELDGRDWIAGAYSVADIAIAPWLRALDFYGTRETVGWDNHPALVAYLERFLERPAVQKGMVTPPRD